MLAQLEVYLKAPARLRLPESVQEMVGPVWFWRFATKRNKGPTAKATLSC